MIEAIKQSTIAPSAQSNNTPWPEAVVELARRLWSVGESASSISRSIWEELRIVKTRNAVIAMMHRQNLTQGRKSVAISSVPARRGPRRRGPVAVTRLLQAPADTIPSLDLLKSALAEALTHPRRVDLMALTATSCRFPLNDGGPFLFCGAGALEGFPYCEPHARLCYDKLRTAARTIDAGRLLDKRSIGGTWR